MCFYPNLTLTLHHMAQSWTGSNLGIMGLEDSGNSDLKPHITIDLHNCVAQKLVPPVAPESGPQAKVVVAKMAKEEMVSNILMMRRW